EQVDVVAPPATRTTRGDVRLDRARERRPHCFAELAGDAALLPVGVATLRVQAAKTGRLRRRLFQVLHRDVRPGEELTQRDPQTEQQLGQEERLQKACRRFHLVTR